MVATEELGLEFIASGFETLQAKLQEQQNEIARLEGVYRRTKQAIDDYNSGIKGVSLTEDQRAKKLSDLQKVLDNTGAKLGQLRTIENETAQATNAMAASFDNAEKQADELGDQAEDTTQKASILDSIIKNAAAVALGNMLSSAASTAVHALASVGGAFVDLGKQALDSYASHERLSSAFESLVAREIMNVGATNNMSEALAMAGPRAEELLGWVQQLAFSSPFPEEGVAAAFKTALAYGFTTEEAQRLTAAMIDFAAGTGATESSMNQIALALGQIEAKGKVSGQEVLQLVNAGLAVDQILGEAFGKSTAEIVKMREDGLIPADQAIEAIVSSLERDFGGAAKRQTDSWAGFMSSLDDIKSVGLREFFSGTFQAIQPYVSEFIGTLTSPEFMNGLREIGNRVGEFVGQLMSNLPSIIDAIQPIFDSLSSLAESIGPILSGVVISAFSWGADLISAYAEGIEAASSLVISAVSYIGDIVSSLMQPGSPPKYLPKIDQWGKDTMDTYLDGFTKADFSIFNDIGDTIERFIRASSPSGGSSMFDAIIQSREALAEAITQGKDATAVLESLGSIVGELPGEIDDYVESLYDLSAASDEVSKAQEQLDTIEGLTADSSDELSDIFSGALLDSVRSYQQGLGDLEQTSRELEDAQNALNDVTKKYDDTLAPLNEELARMKAREQEIKDTKELSEWQAVLSNKYATEEEKEKARMAIREIELKKQIRAIEQQRDSEVNAAQDRVDAAEDAQQSAEQLAEEQRKNALDLAKQELELAQANEDAARSAADLATQRIKAIEEYNKLVKEQADTIRKAEEERSKEQERAAREQEKNSEKASKAADAAVKAERDYRFAIADTAGKLMILRDELSKTEVGSVEYYKILTQIHQLEQQKGKGGGSISSVDPEQLKKQAEAAEALRQKYLDLRKASEAKTQDEEKFGLAPAMDTSALSQLTSPSGPMSGIVAFWKENGASIQASMNEMFSIVSKTLGRIASDVGPLVNETLQKLGDWVKENGPNISKSFEMAISRVQAMSGFVIVMWNIVKPIFQALVDIILNLAQFALAVSVGDWQKAWDAIKDTVTSAWEAIKDIFLALAEWVTSWFGTSWQGVLDLWKSNFDQLSVIASLVWNKITTWFQEAVDGISKFMKSLWTGVVDVWNRITSTISGALENAREFISSITLKIQSAWNFVWEQINEKINTVLISIDTFIKETISSLFEWLGLNQDEMYRKWSEILEGMRLIAVEVWRRISEWITTTMSNIASTISSKISEARATFERVLGEMVTAAQNKASEIFTAITSKISEIGTWIANSLETLKGYGVTIIQAISDGISSAAGSIGSAIVSAINSVSLVAGPVWKTLKGFGASIIDGIKSGIIAGWAGISNALTTAFSYVKNNILDAASSIYGSLIAIGGSIMDSILAGLGRNIGRFVEYMTGVLDQIIKDILSALGIPWGQKGSPSIDPDLPGDGQLVEITSRIYDAVIASNVILYDIYDAVRPRHQVQMSPTSIGTINNYYTNSRTNNLTTQSMIRPGGLVLEFESMSLVGK